MMSNSSLLNDLIDALKCLPSVGAKTAQRMAFHLLEHDRASAMTLALTLQAAMESIGNCTACRTFSETPICRICNTIDRQQNTLCVVENPSDVLAIEQATDYRGYYFVLMGKLSPLDGIGPEDLGLDILASRLSEGKIEELILATNPTIEGEVTAHYISELAKKQAVKTTRIAHGVPVGGELDYVDSGTLSHAFSGRRNY